MSGPIVRKYGFPNHEQIFGRRPLEHGVDDAAPKPESEPAKAKAKVKAKKKAPAKPKP